MCSILQKRKAHILLELLVDEEMFFLSTGATPSLAPRPEDIPSREEVRSGILAQMRAERKQSGTESS